MPDRHITFCLCPRLPIFGVTAALEVLRHANRFTTTPFYNWSFICENDEPVQDSNGLWLHPSAQIAQTADADIALVVAGFEPSRQHAPKMLRWLAKQAAASRIIGGITNGAFVLAQGGLLDGYAATVHWEDFSSFCNLYPQVKPRYQRFVIDRNRMTCSGGSTTLDLFIEVVRQDLGHELASKVSRQMLLQDYAVPAERDTQLVFDGSHHFSPRVQRALSLLDAGVDGALTVDGLAQRVGVSRRELLRLLRRETGMTPTEILNQRRLERAQSLILHTHLPIASISAAVGFSSQSHLTTRYRQYFGTTPALHRREHQINI